jgi:hypothetical protein
MPTPRNRPAAPEPKAPVGFPGDDDYEAGDADWAGADSFLAPVVPAISWPEIGASVTGIVVSAEVAQQTDLDGAPKTFEGGDIRMQLIVTLQTDLVEDDDDDGLRRVFVKGAMVRPFRAEMKRNKVRGLRPGGRLTVTYREDGEVTKRGFNPPKLFDVAYEAPGS